MKITVDTNFLVSATQWDYSVAHKLLLKLLDKNIQIFTTKDILDEFSEILVRDFQYTTEEIRKTLSFYHTLKGVVCSLGFWDFKNQRFLIALKVIRL